MERIRILVIEDQPLLRALMEDFLSDRGFAPVIVPGAAEALEKLEHGSYSLIITDLYMPQMDGIEFTRKVRLNPALLHVPVMMITSEKSDGKKTEAMRAGVSEYLVKPVTGDMLETHVRRLLGG